MKVTAELLKQLSDRATPGTWTRSHYIIYGSGHGEGALVALTSDIKYLNHTSDPKRSAHDARFITALVNAYRSGDLMFKEPAP
jgi:hypothetical protein